MNISKHSKRSPLVIFDFRGGGGLKAKSACLAGNIQTLIRKEARYCDGKRNIQVKFYVAAGDFLWIWR